MAETHPAAAKNLPLWGRWPEGPERALSVSLRLTAPPEGELGPVGFYVGRDDPARRFQTPVEG